MSSTFSLLSFKAAVTTFNSFAISSFLGEFFTDASKVDFLIAKSFTKAFSSSNKASIFSKSFLFDVEISSTVDLYSGLTSLIIFCFSSFETSSIETFSIWFFLSEITSSAISFNSSKSDFLLISSWLADFFLAILVADFKSFSIFTKSFSSTSWSWFNFSSEEIKTLLLIDSTSLA